ncbi:hypothetical protein SCP_0703930 [Sparassis crispa]|uniref:F-box domain-containing protein n=1 Tax=Sparassis crispa TaxID=139825 RepID=A0A401GSL9_9APHY|nr:hypothetical protein SCP_0703930 [Sparassis crispa]GBE85207.1 hypothetical protein SCP_0703930 [Sparassis crispa]
MPALLQQVDPSPIPIDRLPPELLIEIFALCGQDADHGLTPLTLGSVCHYWRDTVYSSCRVWQHLYLNDMRNPHASQCQARLWLARCHPLPIYIHVHLDQSVDMLLPLLSPILPLLYLWGRCTITGKLQEDIEFPELGETKGRLAQLQVIVKGLSGTDGNPDSDVDGEPVPTFRSFHPLGPNLYHDVLMRVSVSALPELNLMSPLRITSLTITEYSLSVSTDAARMLGFLTSLPLLHTFNFYGWPHESTTEANGSLSPVVPLLRLRTLLLRSTCAVRTLLSHIHAPALRELYLEHTNVDFELLHDPYAHAHEDGDSEDEAHDFSQSPWSDHATGMGLRTLVRRSRPPLRVLEMDYADMRTKDFRWCFDRLDQLQEFRIVASDMSNTVIGMLAPFRPNARPSPIVDGDGAKPTVEQEVAPLRVRLPHLISLELWHCQRLAGDAVVAALCERVAFTDAASVGNAEVETLGDVAVIGCSDFLFHHAVELAPVLGNRLRIT